MQHAWVEVAAADHAGHFRHQPILVTLGAVQHTICALSFAVQVHVPSYMCMCQRMYRSSPCHCCITGSLSEPVHSRSSYWAGNYQTKTQALV